MAAQSTLPPDLVLVNGRVYTLDPGRPWAEALAIAGDRIAAVGTTAEIRALAGPGNARHRPEGAFVCPASTTPTCTWTPPARCCWA